MHAAAAAAAACMLDEPACMNWHARTGMHAAAAAAANCAVFYGGIKNCPSVS